MTARIDVWNATVGCIISIHVHSRRKAWRHKTCTSSQQRTRKIRLLIGALFAGVQLTTSDGDAAAAAAAAP